LSKRVEGKLIPLDGPQTVTLKPMFTGGLVGSDQEARLRFELEAAELYRAVAGADRSAAELQIRISHLTKALDETPGDTEPQAQQVRSLNRRLADLRQSLSGDSTISSRYEPVPLSINGRIGFIVGGTWDSQAAITPNYSDSLAVVRSEFSAALTELQSITTDLTALENTAEKLKAPWTPGRTPKN
ncbi:MAG TPA: hypothetical protein VKN35_09955, partial [Xanthomonadales bacterium]|nr:hypothetical protein [Xanthomonadales bacterium]